MSDLGEQIKPILEEFIKETLEDASEAAISFGAEMAKEMAKYLAISAAADDEQAERNLEMLKSTALNIAVKHELKAAHAAMEKLEEVLMRLAKFGLIALKAAIV